MKQPRTDMKLNRVVSKSCKISEPGTTDHYSAAFANKQLCKKIGLKIKNLSESIISSV